MSSSFLSKLTVDLSAKRMAIGCLLEKRLLRNILLGLWRLKVSMVSIRIRCIEAFAGHLQENVAGISYHTAPLCYLCIYLCTVIDTSGLYSSLHGILPFISLNDK